MVSDLSFAMPAREEPPLEAWPQSCSPEELIDRLLQAGRGRFAFAIWNEDFQPVHRYATDICSLLGMDDNRNESQKISHAVVEGALRHEFRRQLPKWVWLGGYGENTVVMAAYELSGNGRYERLSTSRAEWLARQTTEPADDRRLSPRAMIDLIYQMGYDYVSFLSPSGENITPALLSDASFSMFLLNRESVWRAMQQLRPAYIVVGHYFEQEEPSPPRYILQQDGTYVFGWNLMTCLLDCHASDHLDRKRQDKRPEGPGQAQTDGSKEMFRLLMKVVMTPALESGWPETCAPEELIDRLIRLGMGPGVFHFWDDAMKPVLESETDSCSRRFPLALRIVDERKRVAKAHASLARDFPRLRPKWVWLASYGADSATMKAYERDDQGIYRLLTQEKTDRLLQKTIHPAGTPSLSMRDLLVMIGARPGAAGIACDSTGRDISEAVFPTSRQLSVPEHREASLRAMERVRPRYMAVPVFMKREMLEPWYILQEDGTYIPGWNPMTDLIDRFGTDPIDNAVRWRKERAIEENSRHGTDDRPFSPKSPIDRDEYARGWYAP